MRWDALTRHTHRRGCLLYKRYDSQGKFLITTPAYEAKKEERVCACCVCLCVSACPCACVCVRVCVHVRVCEMEISLSPQGASSRSNFFSLSSLMLEHKNISNSLHDVIKLGIPELLS